MVERLLRALPDWATRRPNGREISLLEILYETFLRERIWPQYANVEATLSQQTGDELAEVLAGFPFGMLLPDPADGQYVNDQQPITASLFGLAFVEAAEADLSLFVDILRWAIRERLAYVPPAQGPAELDIPIRDLLEYFRSQRRLIDAADVRRVFALLQYEPVGMGWMGAEERPEGATIRLDRRLRDYRGVETLDDYFRLRPVFRRPVPPSAAGVEEGEATELYGVAERARDIMRKDGPIAVSDLADRLGLSVIDATRVIDEFFVDVDGEVRWRGPGRGGGWGNVPPGVNAVAGTPSEGDDARASHEVVGENESAEGPAELGSRARALSDLAADVDRLGFAPLVDGIAELVSTPHTKLPLAIAVTGEWGAGKSSVMRQLRMRLEQTRPPRLTSSRRNGGDQAGLRHWHVAEFDAWKYERSERLWAALTKAIYDCALKQRTWLGKIWFKTRLETARQGGVIFAAKLIVQLVPGIAGLILLGRETWHHRPIGWAAIGFSVVAVAASSQRRWSGIGTVFVDPFKRAIDQYTFRARFETQLGFTAEAEQDVRALIRCLRTGPRGAAVAVFVDDLDRCSPSHVVDVVEAINQIFNSDSESECLFVLGMDIEVIAASLNAAYAPTIAALPNGARRENFGRDYLRKVAQLFVVVPQPTESDLDRLLRAIAGEDPDASRPPLSEEAVRRAEASLPDQELSSPVEIQRAVDSLSASQAIKEEVLRRERTKFFGSDHEDLLAAESEAIRFLDRNPRMLKQFDNAYRLQLHVANDTPGHSLNFNYPQLVALAKWVVLRLRWPELADRFVRDPDLLRRLEHREHDDSEGIPTLVMDLLATDEPEARVSQIPQESYLHVV